MSISMGTVGIVLLTFVFLYLIVYQKNRLVGNIMFLVLGLGIIYIDVNLAFMGIIIFIGGIGSLIYDFFTPSKNDR